MAGVEVKPHPPPGQAREGEFGVDAVVLADGRGGGDLERCGFVPERWLRIGRADGEAAAGWKATETEAEAGDTGEDLLQQAAALNAIDGDLKAILVANWGLSGLGGTLRLNGRGPTRGGGLLRGAAKCCGKQ